MNRAGPDRAGRPAPGLARRKVVSVSERGLVHTERLLPGSPIPLLLQPAVAGLGLVEWAAAHHADVDALLLEHRALLFRGFDVGSVAEFEQFATVTSRGPLLEYRDRSTPRAALGDRIYLSTIYPAELAINLHNEGTYWIAWPRKLYFGCFVEPTVGGQTPIADVRNVLARIDPATRARFAEKHVMYVRNYNDGAGLTWQEVFQASDRAAVEAYCQNNDIEYAWKDGDRLRTRQVRPAIRRHPATGEPVWFNHAAFFHISTHEADVGRALLDTFGEGNLPYNTFYGDGTPIEPETAAAIREAYRQEKVVFSWRKGDVLMLDNMTIAHGREPYGGERKVAVAMSEPYAGEDARRAGGPD